MKFFTIFSVATGFFGALVAGAVVKSKSPSVPLDLGTFCVFCEAVPSIARQSCYTHCNTLTQNAVTADDTVKLNITQKASTAHSSAPAMTNTTLSTSPASPEFVSDFTADTSGICDFCDSFTGAMAASCHMKCRKHAPMKAPWVINALWDFCWDGCEMHNCGTGPWLAQCITVCHMCFGVAPRPQWPESPGKPSDIKWDGCFCPMVEFAPQYQGDHDRYLAGETEDEDGFTVHSESETENEWD